MTRFVRPGTRPATLATAAVLIGLFAPAGSARAQSASLLSPAPTAGTPSPALPAAPGQFVHTPPAAAPAAPGGAALIPPPAVPVEPVIPGASPPTVATPANPGAAAPVTTAVAKPKRKPAPPAAPRETALSTDPTPTLTPETFFATAKASERYASIADAGGWPTIPGPLSPRSGKGHPVATLRLRLAIEGDLDGPSRGGAGVSMDEGAGMFDTRWTPDLTEAVERFQARHGLKQTGVVAGATLKAMNVSARVRFTELASSAQRLAGRQFSFGDRYVVVNLPSAAVEAVESGQVVHRYVAIVGDPDHASPEVDAKAIAVNLNPTWTVPVSIIRKEIMPKMQRDPSYLSREKIRVLDGSGKPVNPASIDWSSERATTYILRQDSGKGNSLGSIRINMPNQYSVYMHDTPSKGLFGGDMRFLSHGCVRVQGVYDLAAWLLKDSLGAPDGTWSREEIEAKIADGQHEEVKLNQPVPVAWVYLTGWANGDGVANFRDDVYGLDTVGAAPAEASVDPDLLPPQN